MKREDFIFDHMDDEYECRVLPLMRQGGSSYGEKNDLGETVHVCSRV